MKTLITLFAILIAALSINIPVSAQTPGTWTLTGSMNKPRGSAAAVLLQSGKILICGGWDGSQALASAELYDPNTGTWTLTGSMNVARTSHTATLLPDGRVLIAGGWVALCNTTTSAEIYDPLTETWSNTGSMQGSRCAHRAVLITSGNFDGQVLVTGGCLNSSDGDYGNCDIGDADLITSELFDPNTGLWSSTGSLVVGGYWDGSSPVTTLPDGRIMIVGGWTCCPYESINQAELYDPTNQTWTSTAAKQTAANYAPILLDNGLVLVAGGCEGIQPNNLNVAEAELFDPVTGTWTATGNMTIDRNSHTMSLLQNGQVLVAGGGHGGWGWGYYLNSSELMSASGTWSITGNMNSIRAGHIAITLPNGQILALGGSNGSTYVSSAELYTPPCISGSTIYADTDNDGYGDLASNIIADSCDLPFGYVLNNTDCNDADASIYPGTEEVFNCLDDNCNGITDEGKWIQKANFAGSSRVNAASFTIGDKAYLATGKTSSGSYLKDLWEYDPVTDVWTQKADMGGKKRYKAVGFAIGNKGYIGTGYDQDGSLVKSFGEYDVATNSWTQKADFGGSGRQDAVGFAINGKGYIGTGGDFLTQHNDFWEYDPATNQWTQKANVGDTLREAAVGFSIDGKGYIGTGSNSNGNKNDFWQYDPATDTWTEKSSFGGTARNAAAGFSVDDKGFIGTGYDGTNLYDDFWQYEPASDTWKQIADLTGTQRAYAVGFSVSGKGYVTTGGDNSGNAYNDLWQYDAPDFVGLTVYADTDGDGFGDVNDSYFVSDCVIPTGYITDSTDCDDNNASINPAAIEICDGIDNNCDGAIDPLYTFYADADGDGYGNNNVSVTDCTPPSGYVTNNTDCNDAEATIHPDATELCNGIDDNCNAQTDEGLLITFYADADGDLYGNPNSSTLACTLPNGYVTNNTDCDDTNANVYPGAPEILFNGIDDDCDGYIDEFGTGITSIINDEFVFSLFPNPTNGEFEVYLQLNNELNVEAKIEVINLLGQAVYTKTRVLLKGKLKETINLKDEADGIYLVRVVLSDQVFTAQVIYQQE